MRITNSHRLPVSSAVSREATWQVNAPAHTLAGCLHLHGQPPGATTMPTDAHDASSEEHRAQLEQRRAAVAHQLRRLTRELADLDRQLDEAEQAQPLPNSGYPPQDAE
jgi:DNA-binding transcriptional MerR regulator